MPTSCRLGLDVTSVTAWRARLHRTPQVRQVAFSGTEQAWAGTAAHRYAALWAVKESTVKALGTGFHEVGWRGVRIDPPRRQIQVADAPRDWWVTLTRHAHRVVAAVCDTPAHIAIRLHHCPGRGRYATRSALARQAAGLALRELTTPDEPTSWASTPDHQPRLWVGDIPVPVSLSHGDGLIGAAVALPAPHPVAILICPPHRAALPTTTWVAVAPDAGRR